MKIVLFLLFVISYGYQENYNNSKIEPTCFDRYNECVALTVSDDLPKWLANTYFKVFERHVCADYFTICKKYF